MKNKKKHMSGFVPVNFHFAGKVFVVLGVLIMAIQVFGVFLLDWFLVFGIAFIIVGLYIKIFVPKEDI